jgi:hypothetical protein
MQARHRAQQAAGVRVVRRQQQGLYNQPGHGRGQTERPARHPTHPADRDQEQRESAGPRRSFAGCPANLLIGIGGGYMGSRR